MKEEKKKFNQKEYIINYRKAHKKQFTVDLNIDEYNDLCLLLEQNNLTKVQFVRNALKELQKK